MLALAVIASLVGEFGSNPGALDMYEYVPANLPSGRPIVVVLHGCTQNAAAIEHSGWNSLADKYQFAVVYAQQRSANQQLGCFTWYGATDIARTGGEAESIFQMVDRTIATHGSDATRVYVTGVSAGGAFSAVMLAAYPDRFRAGSIMAGVPYKCATDVVTASSCTTGATKTAEEWGALVRGATSFSGSYPRVQIWHGAMDYTVNTANATELVKQWTNVWGIDQTADATETISTATRTQHVAGGSVAVELYMVNGMGHAIAIGADAMGPCPATSAAFYADAKICSTLRAAEFFGLLTASDMPDGLHDDDHHGGCGGCRVGGSNGLLIAVACLLLSRRRRRAML